MKRAAKAIIIGMCMASAAGCASPKGSKSTDSNYVIETDPKYNVETRTLLKKFPITFQTSANTEEEKGIQNRMLNGFNCWNEGYDAWEHWGEVLYSPESIYNVNGVRMTLKEYQQAMNIALQRTEIIMGDFDNMILSGNWAAIRYQTTNKNPNTGDLTPAPVTEFVRFKDFGEKGMKVDEGWGGIKGNSYEGMMHFVNDEEKAEQQERLELIAETVLPETDNLEEKYPVLFPTEISGEKHLMMKKLLLQDIDSWNKGYDAYADWAGTLFADNVQYGYNDFTFDLNGLKDNAESLLQEKDIKRVKIYNILTSDDWAAIHSWHVVNRKDGSREVFDSMAFYHFTSENGSLKVDKCWIKENS